MSQGFQVPQVLREAYGHLDDAGALAATKAYEHAVAYFVGTAGNRRYAGADFEMLGHSWRDDAFVNTITPSDLLALGALSTPIKKYTAAELLGSEFQGKASELLAQIPVDAQIDDPEAAAWLADGSPASQLYGAVRSISGMGKTRTSKLLARKRPGLIPIRDGNVERALDALSTEEWWEPYRLMAADGSPSPIAVARRIHELAGLPDVVTPLRVLDAILWRSVESPDAQGVDEPDRDE